MTLKSTDVVSQQRGLRGLRYHVLCKRTELLAHGLHFLRGTFGMLCGNRATIGEIKIARDPRNPYEISLIRYEKQREVTALFLLNILAALPSIRTILEAAPLVMNVEIRELFAVKYRVLNR